MPPPDKRGVSDSKSQGKEKTQPISAGFCRSLLPFGPRRRLIGHLYFFDFFLLFGVVVFPFLVVVFFVFVDFFLVGLLFFEFFFGFVGVFFCFSNASHGV